MTCCQSCSTECIEILDLGNQPICNRFLSSRKEFKDEKLYPLKLVWCPKCTLVQLSEVLPLSIVFGKGFNYLTGSYPEAVAYFRNLAHELIRKFRLKKGDLVIDIGSNDGTFLKCFQDRGMKVLGVEPAIKPADIAIERGIQTIKKPFESAVSNISYWTSLDGKPKLVTALNVLAHTNRIHDFLDGVRVLGAPFVSQSHYLGKMIDNNEWDMIYHEHSRFYTASSLNHLFSSHGLNLYDVEPSTYLGGSFIAYAEPPSPLPEVRTERLNSMLESESKFKSLKTYKEFAHDVLASTEWLQNMLMEIKIAGKSIAGVGAPMKSSTLLNHCKIGTNWLDYTTELNPLKVGTYTPGVHIPVRAESRIFEHKPDFLLILSWNVADRIIRSFKERGYEGKFIVPIPEARVIA